VHSIWILLAIDIAVLPDQPDEALQALLLERPDLALRTGIPDLAQQTELLAQQLGIAR